MNALNEIYDFITGGSAVSPFGVAFAILAAFWLPAYRLEAFVTIVSLTFVISTFEKPA